MTCEFEKPSASLLPHFEDGAAINKPVCPHTYIHTNAYKHIFNQIHTHTHTIEKSMDSRELK